MTAPYRTAPPLRVGAIARSRSEERSYPAGSAAGSYESQSGDGGHDRETLFAAARQIILAAIPDTLVIYVFGSFARHQEWPDSDIDLAVLLPTGRTIQNRLGLVAALAVATGREVDLIDLRRASDVLRRQVLEYGVKLHEGDRCAVLAW